MARTYRLLAGLVVGSILVGGCAALRDDMQRAENAYTAARYEEALVWLEDLESETPDMDPDMRARFYYLRGMTAYRLDRRNDALHYLAVCREVAGEQGDGDLQPDWRKNMDRILAELTPTDASFRARDPESESGGAAVTSGGESSPPADAGSTGGDAGGGRGGEAS